VGYEWWYFDALSDDGRDALVIIFLANFVFSPRYNRAASRAARRIEGALPIGDDSTPGQFPAVVFCLYRDGRPIVRAINEYTRDDFRADTRLPSCVIGNSGFYTEADDSGVCFRITLAETLRRGERLSASFSFQLVEGDFDGDGRADDASDAASHDWNLVAPRCRVKGTYSFAERGSTRGVEARQFQGTGYHDHNRDRRWLPATVAEWQWGRAHFVDATAVFYCYREREDAAATTRLFVVRDKSLSAYDAVRETGRLRRDRFGVNYSRRMSFTTQDESARIALHVSQQRTVDRSFFYLRFIGEAALDLADGETRRAPVLAEHLAPRSLSLRWLDWLTDMRIGRDGRAAFLK
jgi:carotenoid 1,2-hydratase